MPRPNEFTDLVRQSAVEVVAELIHNHYIPSPWLDRHQAAAYMGIKARGLDQMRKEGTAPESKRPSHKILRWHVDTLDAWMNAHPNTEGESEESGK